MSKRTEMKRKQLLHLLRDINVITLQDAHEEDFQIKVATVLTDIDLSYDNVTQEMTSLVSLYGDSKISWEWKYILLNFYLLERLHYSLSTAEHEVLSVQESKIAKDSLRTLMTIGVLKNIQPNLPHYMKTDNTGDPLYAYNILKCTTYGFSQCIKYANLRMLILPHLLQGILVALYQICYCQLKKPKSNSVIESEKMYIKLKKEQLLFKEILENLRLSIHPTIFVKETMVLLQYNSPAWFKKSVSNTLTTIMKSPKGIEHITTAMLNGTDDDRTKTWKVLEVATKLIISSRKIPEFQENICVQVVSLLDFTKTANLFIFERLFVSCTKSLYLEDTETCKKVFFSRLTSVLSSFACKEHVFSEDEDITNDIKQTVRLIYGIFLDNDVNLPCLPINLLKKVIHVIFNFYNSTVNSLFSITNKELKEILMKYIKFCPASEIDQLFDNFLFGFSVTDILQFRHDLLIQVDGKIIVKQSQHVVVNTAFEATQFLSDVLDTEKKIILFGYLLKCLTEKEKYFKTFSNQDLLSLEEDANNPVMERMLTVHKLLSQLSEDNSIQKSLKTEPDSIIIYFKNILSHAISVRSYESTIDSTETQTLFLVIVILDTLVSNCLGGTLAKYHALVKPLQEICEKTCHAELKHFCENVIKNTNTQSTKNVCENTEKERDKTELDKALEDICDPLLPVRGHGLLTLTKLIENKDQNAMERKQYLLNIFLLSMKNEDSFIYLNAVQGLAALTNLFPDTVLETLCDEYIDLAKKNEDVALKTRMKLGETLVRVTKLLGEMAVKYKAILLNTFLLGTRDEEHLIRASSLSNLGEVCRVLGYKLGTIVEEVLVCVHAIIATDKSVEARRAAVTVIRQLFAGLDCDMITFLKDDILPVYRTLKEIYYHDKDDIMRLQAQLALEELNENMKDFVFPKPQLNSEKKAFMLN